MIAPTLDLRDGLKRMCELQQHYSADNTPEMQERHAVLFKSIKPAMEALGPILAPALGRFGADFQVDASGGIGRKTELPWVRFCSQKMSPRPTEGFYCVVHFSTDGSAMHVTVGCGSSRFFNGYSVVLPGPELDAQTSWARSVLVEELGSLEPFVDPPEFGASRKLPRSFQRATAIAKRVPYGEIGGTDIETLLVAAAERLRLVYEAQSTGRDLTPADQSELEIAEVVRPARARGTRQGYGLSAEARSVVELQAMKLAEEWLCENGYSVENCSAKKPYDFEAISSAHSIKVEVKGTTSDRADAILMTRNEVDLHTSELGQTALIVVSKIQLSGSTGSYSAAGGVVEAMVGWNIGDWHLEPTTYRLVRKGF